MPGHLSLSALSAANIQNNPLPPKKVTDFFMFYATFTPQQSFNMAFSSQTML